MSEYTPEYVLASALTPILYGLVASSLYYLGSRAKITEFLWSHYPPAFDRFMMCAACTGFWWGLGAAFVIGWWHELPFLLLPGRYWMTPVVVALTSVVLTPVFGALHLRALEYTNAMPLEESESTPPEQPKTVISPSAVLPAAGNHLGRLGESTPLDQPEMVSSEQEDTDG
jgi:hypothetical protein